MPVLTFEMKDVLRLQKEIESAQSFKPTMDHLYDPDNHVDGIMRDRNGLTEAEANAKDGYFFPSADSIRKDAIGPCLQLVGDQGVYLITNAEMGDNSSPISRDTVAYAKGCNPNVDEDFYERKRSVWGGDDGSATIPASWITTAVEEGVKSFKLRLNKKSITLVI